MIYNLNHAVHAFTFAAMVFLQYIWNQGKKSQIAAPVKARTA